MAKQLTRDQVQSRKDKAVRFLEYVKDDPDRAAEVEDEDLESYAERRGFEIVDNPRKRSLETMANSSWSKDDLLDRIDELESENSDLQDQLDAIQDIDSPPADDDTDDGDSDAGDDDATDNAAAADDY